MLVLLLYISLQVPGRRLVGSGYLQTKKYSISETMPLAFLLFFDSKVAPATAYYKNGFLIIALTKRRRDIEQTQKSVV